MERVAGEGPELSEIQGQKYGREVPGLFKELFSKGTNITEKKEALPGALTLKKVVQEQLSEMARSLRTSFFGLILVVVGGGCAERVRGPVVFYLDGAGWYASAGSVESGLRKAGYKGVFQRFSWSAFLGPAHDHLINAKSGLLAGQLARRIEKARAANPDAPIHVMGLSAGTSLVLLALEKLDEGVQVDNVVLFSSSVSSKHNLTKAMRHVKRNMYATTSPHDSILSTLPVNADGKGGPPAGQMGFRIPSGGGRETIAAYQHVINLPWQPSYLGFGWNGSHTSVTDSEFVAGVIAPRVLKPEPYPLDRSIAATYAQSSTVSR